MRFFSEFYKRFRSAPLVYLCISALFLASCADGLNNTDNSQVRTPQNLIANPGARTVDLNWQGDPAATSYTVYWEVSRAVESKEEANTETVSIPHFEHTQLTNGATYYYRVSAHVGSKESELSEQVQATQGAFGPWRDEYRL